MLASSLAAALALTMQGNSGYTVEILYQQKRFLMSRTYRISEEIDLRAGDFEIPDPADGEGPLLAGEITMRGSDVMVAMEICEPGSDPCSVVATPEILFRMGTRAQIRQNAGRAVWHVEFEPN